MSETEEVDKANLQQVFLICFVSRPALFVYCNWSGSNVSIALDAIVSCFDMLDLFLFT